MADDYPGDITTTASLPINGTVRGHIDSATDEDWFHLDLQPGAAYLFNAAAGDGTEPMIYVYGRTGGLPYVMYTNDSDYLNRNQLTTPYSWVDKDDYYLWVKSDHPADYTVGVRRVADDYLNDESAAIPLSVGSGIGAQIDYRGDEEYFRISATLGSTYKVTLKADSGVLPVGAALKMVGSYGWADFSYTTEGGALVMNLKADGTRDYYFKVDTDPDQELPGPVKYHVGLTGNVRILPPDDYPDNAPDILIPAGGSASARLDYAGDTEYFKLAAVAGTTYTIRLSADSGVLPPNVDIWRATSSTNEQPRTYMDGTAMVLQVKAPSTGSLTIGVRADMNTPLAAPVPYHVTSIAASDATAPQMSAAKGTVDGVLKLSFNEPVRAGVGTIELVDNLGKIAGTWDMAGIAVTVDGSTIVIDPGHVLLPGEYNVRVNGTAVTDLSGNALNSFSRSQPVNMSFTADGGHVARPFHGAADGVGPNDTGVLAGRLEDFRITRDGHYTIAEGLNQSFTYTDIERLMFTGSDDVIVLAPTAAVSQAWRLYQAAFDRVPDKQGLGYWLYQQEHGTSLQAMAGRFLASPEFTALYGANVGNAEFVASLYHNVLHRDGEAAGLAYHIGNLERGVSRADVLAGFSESPENQAAVADLIGKGFTYTPYG